LQKKKQAEEERGGGGGGRRGGKKEAAALFLVDWGGSGKQEERVGETRGRCSSFLRQEGGGGEKKVSLVSQAKKGVWVGRQKGGGKKRGETGKIVCLILFSLRGWKRKGKARGAKKRENSIHPLIWQILIRHKLKRGKEKSSQGKKKKEKKKSRASS